MRTVTGPAGTPAQTRQMLQESLDAGKRLYVSEGRYVIDRPLFMDVNGGSIEGDGESTEIYNSQSGGVLLLGLKRKTLSQDHYLPCGFRTCADSRIVFQSSPWSKLSPQMTISCTVTTNIGWGTNQTPLFGSMYNGQPGPWYCMVANGGTVLAFMFKTADGVVHTALMPIAPNTKTLQINIPVDLVAGTIGPFRCNPPLLPNSAWATPDQQLFQIGAVGDGLMSPANYDLTFSQLSLPWISLVGPFNDNPPQPPYVHAYGSEGHSVGFFQGALTNGDTIGGLKVQDLKLTASPKYGQGIGIGLAYDPRIEGCHIGYGSHNIGSINAGASYLVRLRDCVLEQASNANLYFSNATVSALGLSFKYFGSSAAVLKGCGGFFTDCITTDSPTCKYVFKMLDNCGNGGEYSFRGGFSDFESKPPASYFYCERDPNTPITELIVSGMRLGLPGSIASSVLKDSPLGGPATPAVATLPKWMTVQSDPCWKVNQ